MAFNIGIQTIVANLGVSFEWVVTIVIFFGGILFYAKDYKLGVIMHFFSFALLFAWFYYAGYNYTPVIVLFFIFLIIMALSLYTISSNKKTTGLI